MSRPAAIAIFSEILAIDQRLRDQLAHSLPLGLELSHFIVLNHLVATKGECTPAQLAEALHLSRGAITNTLGKLDGKGYVHIRSDWEDARRKWVIISEEGRRVREIALNATAPVLERALGEVGDDEMRGLLSALRKIRNRWG